MFFATRLSYFPLQSLSALRKHCGIRIDVYSSTAPKKSSPPLDKSCKKTGFGVRLSEGDFPFIIGECFPCQCGDPSVAFRRSAVKGVRRWAPPLPAGDGLFRETLQTG